MVLGIDPGATGGIFALSEDRGLAKMFRCSSVHAETVAAIRDALNYLGGHVFVAMVEQVHAFPGQGVSSVFSFGERYGVIQGALAALGVNTAFVHPKTWQKEFSLSVSKAETESAKNQKADRRKKLKAKSYATAASLFPRCSIDKEQADAALIAEYALRKYGRTS